MKCNNICVIGVPEKEQKDKGAEGLLEQTIAQNFTNLGKETLKSRRHRELPSAPKRDRSSP